jgi:hypothetical protein
LQLRQELDECTQQLLLVARAQFHQQGGNSTNGGLSVDGSSDNVQEALAARLATTQVGWEGLWDVVGLGLLGAG